MKDEDILLPAKKLEVRVYHHREIELLMIDYAREAVRMNKDVWQRASEEYKTRAAELNHDAPSPLPFNLESATRGDPLVTRSGKKAKFIGYVEEADKGNRVICFVEGSDRCTAFADDGQFLHGRTDDEDLFLAPKPKRTVWVNVERYGGKLTCFAYFDKQTAELANSSSLCGVATAVPIQIDDAGGAE